MKKQSKNLKLNKSVVSGLTVENAGEIKGGKTGAQGDPFGQCHTQWQCPPTQPCEVTYGTGCQTDPNYGC